MSSMFIRYKRKFRNDLRPVFAMLQVKKNNMTDPEWELVVKRTFQNVNINPAEYLGNDLPGEGLTSDVLAEIEQEFLKEIRTFRQGSPQ
jgi:hypothetical protein